MDFLSDEEFGLSEDELSTEEGDAYMDTDAVTRVEDFPLR